EVRQRDVLEELVGLRHQDQDDADGDDDGDGGAQKQQRLDDALTDVARLLLGEPRADNVIRQGSQGLGGSYGTHRFSTGKSSLQISFGCRRPRKAQKTGGVAPLPFHSARLCDRLTILLPGPSAARSSARPCSRRRTWCRAPSCRQP